MNISSTYILNIFAHVFKNEFNSRKILHAYVDERWGSEVMTYYVCSSKAMLDWRIYGKDYYNAKCNRLKSLSRTLVLTEDMFGNIQLFQFWLDFSTGENGYCEINKSESIIRKTLVS